METTLLPAPTVPAPGKPAVSAADATGAAGMESAPAASSATAQLSEAEILAAFLGEVGDETPQARTPKPEGKAGKKLEPAPTKDAVADADADALEEEDSEGEPDQEQEREGGEKPKERGHLGHLVDALLKDPENENIRKRVEDLLGKPAQLNAQIKELQAQLKETQGPPVVSVAAQAGEPLGHVTSLAQLEQEVAMATAWEEWCEEHPEGGQYDPKNPEATLTEAEVKAQLRLAKAVQRAAPAREKYLGKVQEVRQGLRETHPELFEKDSGLLGEVSELLKQGRVTSRNPDYLQDALDLLEGRQARMKRAKGIKTVELDTQAAAARGGAPEKAAATTTRSAPAGGGATRQPALKPGGKGLDVAAAKERAQKGDTRAEGELLDAFVNQGAGRN